MTLNAIASQAENEARRAASLRRIAIVLQDLPSDVAQSLLADLSPDARQRVRREVRTLVDVDPMERKRALESFTGSLKRQAARDEDARYSSENPNSSEMLNSSESHRPATNRLSSAGTPQDEIAFSAANRVASAPSQVAPASPSTPLNFLDQVADQDLLDLLKDEHPQTKAVVFASIEPSRAARILPQLGGAQRQDMLSRIGRLQTLPEEMLSDLASSFQSRVERLQSSRNRNPLQQLIDQNAIDHPGDSAVWDPSLAATHVPKSAVAVSPRLQAILAEMPSAEPETRQSAHQHHAQNRDQDAATASQRLRDVTRDEAVSSSPQSSHNVTNSSNIGGFPSEQSTDAIHQELVRLPAKRLCEALGRVDTRVAILALCGLPNKVADAAIACLPRTAANQVRQHLMSVGSMEIREIDRAKEEVARASAVSGVVGQGREERTQDKAKRLAA